MGGLKGLAIYNVAGQIIKTVLTIAAPILLIRLMTVKEYGEYQTVLLVTGLVASILGFNLVHNLWYFFPLAKDKEERKLLLSNNLIVMLIISAMLIVSSLVFKGFVIDLFGLNNYTDIYIYGVFLVAFTLIYQSINNIFVLEGKRKVLLIYPAVNQIVRLSFVLGAYLLYNNVRAIIIGLLLWSGLNTIFFINYLWRHYNISFFVFDKAIFIKQFKYIWPFGVSSIIGTIGNRADKVILSSLFSVTDFAIYRVGNFKLPFISTVYSSIGNAILPKLSELSDSQEGKFRALLLWKKLVVRQAIITIPTVFFFIFIAEDFINFLFGIEYDKSTIVFQFFLTSFFIEMFGFGYLLRAFGDTKPMLYANIAKLIVAIGLGYVLILKFGYSGAAITYILAYFSDGFVQLYFTKKHLKISFKSLIPWVDIVVMFLISFGLLSILVVFKYFFRDSFYIIFYLSLCAAVYFSSYLLVIIIFPRYSFVKSYAKQVLMSFKKN